MALVVKHAFHSNKLDGADPQQIQPQRDWNADHAITGSGWMIAGQVIDFLGHTIPSYLLECYGQSVAAATYPLLFAAMVKQGTVTFTLGTPGVVNWTGHGLPINSKIRFSTTGTLPTDAATGLPLVANQDYYIIATGYTANSFQIASTLGGVAINLSAPFSGTHTGVNAQYGVSADLSTFTVPDLRGRVTAGLDTMGGVPAGRLTGQTGGVSGLAVGSVGGTETHVLTPSQLAVHQHNNNPPDPTVNIAGLTVTVNSGGAHTHAVTGTVDAVGDHTHTSSGGTVGSAGGHSHALTSLVLSTQAAHTHTFALGADTVAGHQHSMATGYERLVLDIGSTGATNDIIQSISSPLGVPGVNPTDVGGSHNHPVSGTINSAGSHTHTLTSGATDAVANHTHTFTGLTIAAAGGHSHTFSSGAAASAGAHTHTTSVGGSATSAQADFLSDAAGGDAAHNNVQPTFVIRKLVYVG